MGLQHATLPIHGVQFHPESIASEHGHRYCKNFLALTRSRMSDALKPLINAAAEGPLTRAQARQPLKSCLNGDATPSQIGGLLMALRTRGETVDEYAAAASRDARQMPAGPRARRGDGHCRHRRRRQTHAEHIHRHGLCRRGRGRPRGQTRQPQPVIEIRDSRCAGADGHQRDGWRGCGGTRAAKRPVSAS